MAADVGDLAKTIGIEVMARASAEQLTKGDIVSFSATGVAEIASITLIISNIGNGFGVCMQTPASTTAVAQIAVGNTYVYAAAAAGELVPHQLVGVGATGTVGVTGINISTDTATGITTLLSGIIGRYFGHENEEENATAATTAEVSIIRLGL